MTKSELNRDIKRLWKRFLLFKKPSVNHEEFYKFIDVEYPREFKLLYYASNDFKSLSKKSILMLLVMNRRNPVISQQNFGSKIVIL